MEFPDRLKSLRVKNGYKSRKDFAKALGMPVTTIRNYETGDREPGHDFIRLISKTFGVSSDYLLGLTDEMEAVKDFHVTTNEKEMVEKFRSLDSHGNNLVLTVLEIECSRLAGQRHTTT